MIFSDIQLNSAMSLVITLSAERVVVSRPAETTTLPTTIKIERIVDIPDDKKIFVFLTGLGRVELESLSNDNYDVPGEWTNSSIVDAVTTYINSI